jgi:hypothetical protein
MLAIFKPKPLEIGPPVRNIKIPRKPIAVAKMANPFPRE